MAIYDLEEQEKIDAIKAWWTRWGNTVFAAVGVFALTYAGISTWRWYQNQHAAEAAALYQTLPNEKDPKKVGEGAKAILDKYANTAYAPRAALAAAKASFEAGDLAGAKTSLEWVVSHAEEQELQHIARLRLASVLAEEKKFDDALRVLDGNREESFAAPTARLKGDMFVALGKVAEARAAYRTALDKATEATDKQLLETKLDMLGEAK